MYKDDNYWAEIQRQEREEEEARCLGKMRFEQAMKEGRKPAKKETRVWKEEEIKRLVQTNDKVLYSSLKQLYACQTADEQNIGETRERNGKGFNGVDSKFLSSVSEFLLKKGFLTEKQKYAVRKKLVKYTKQITALANDYELAH